MRFVISLLITVLISHPASGRVWTTNDTCPTGIKVTIPSGEYCDGPNNNRIPCQYAQTPYFGTMVSIHDALSHCPNITSLDLRVAHLGCDSGPDRWNFPFSHNGGDIYPRLKKLRLKGYYFSGVEDTRPPWQMPLQGYNNVEMWTFGLVEWLRKGYFKPWLRAQVYGYPPLPPEMSNLDRWLAAMDWSEIEELSFERCRNSDEIAEKLPSRLHSLHKLESTDISFVEGLPNNTLTNLTWVGRHKDSDLNSILARQGATLQSLELRCHEMYCPYMRNKLNVSILPQLAPKLQRLSMNIPRNGTWPVQDLQILASLPRIRSLEIYSQLQSHCQKQRPHYSIHMADYMDKHGEDYCTGKERLQEPLLDESSTEALFAHMKTANAGGELQSVTFKVGDWSPSWDGPLYKPPWMQLRRAEVICTETNMAKYGKSCQMEVAEGYWPPATKQWERDGWMFGDIELDPEDLDEKSRGELAQKKKLGRRNK